MDRGSSAPLAAIVGPTASGKSDLALALARRTPLEILVADSRQVYRGMDVGTAKPDAAARARVPHHLLDLVAPDEPFSVAEWVAAARALIPLVAARERLPLLVGGSGLYISALVDGYDLDSMPPASALRQELDRELADRGIGPLATRLAAKDPATAARIDLRNPRRVIRALERNGQASEPNRPWVGQLVMIGLRRPLELLDRRINARAARLFSSGLLDEVAALLASGYGASLTPMTGHGYREAAHVLAGDSSVEEAIASTALHTRQYARRQQTWFKRDHRIRWIDAGDLPADAPAVVDQVQAALRSAQRDG